MIDKENDRVQNFKISESLGHVTNRVAIIMRKNLAVRFKEQGVKLTSEEFAILHTLWETDGLFQTEITEKTLKDKTRVTRLLLKLIDKALVEKRIDENDRRNFRIYLTEKGSNLKYKVLPIVRSLMEQASCQVSSIDLETTIITLKKMFANLNNKLLDTAEEPENGGIGGVE